jgi:hypothetical protein
MKRNLTGG